MEVGWKRTAFFMCGVGLFREFLPSAPFFVEYAIEHTNFTSAEVNRDILPVTIYGHFGSMLIFLLITDLLRYKPVIILGGLSAVACWAITIFAYDTKYMAYVRQVLFAIEHSSEVTYITFMYDIVNRTFYKEITSLIHGAMHAGKFLGGVVGQLLLSKKLLSLEDMNYISFGASCAVVGFALFLPGIKWSLYCHPRSDGEYSLDPEQNGGSQQDLASNDNQSTASSSSNSTTASFSVGCRLRGACAELKKDIVGAYSNGHVAKWSLYWAMSRAIYWQISLFTESLWKEIEEETHQHPLNGAVDAAHALISVLIAVFIPFIRIPWELWAESYLAVIAFIQGCVTLWMSRTGDLYIANVTYVIVQTTFEVVFIFGANEIAGSLPDHKATVIFGINALIGILIQAVITNVVTTSYSLALSTRDQFFVYGCCSILLGLVFLAFSLLRRHRSWNVETSKTLTKF